MTNFAEIPQAWKERDTTPIDFIIVGAGAGGAPLATRLAERGFQVLVIEMGPAKPPKPADSVVENTEVPLLHPETTEDPRHSLRFFVDHFGGNSEDDNPRRHHHDPQRQGVKHPEDEAGVFYPRAQGVGGCTIHNAMITICGPSEDWDEIAEESGDPGWSGESIRVYFERLERCHYDRPSWLGRLGQRIGIGTGWQSGRHGHQGWLHTTMASLRSLVKEKKFFRIVKHSKLTSVETGIESLSELAYQSKPELDPNHWETMRRSQEGVSRIPCAITPDGVRSGPRERLLEARMKIPDRLHLLSESLVTRVILDEHSQQDAKPGLPPTACGVTVLRKPHVYEADAQATIPDDNGNHQREDIFCQREVILCGGSFNTPQLLMLSGIGPADHLREKGIQPIVDSAQVGSFLQDRNEVPVIATLTDRFRSLDALQLSSKIDDPILRQWRENRGLPAGTNVYATNGGIIGIFKRSDQEVRVPDLFIFALAGYFPGYHVGWSKPSNLAPGDSDGPDQAARYKRSLSWLILKARSRNDTGTVRLRDNSPFRRPQIDFNLFPENSDGKPNEDVLAIHEGVRFVEQILIRGKQKGLIESYEFPGANDLTDADADDSSRSGRIKKWIRNVAWGHHACGTCRMGRDPNGSVVDTRFRVHGVRGLRVVDASVFPKIPGYFIVTSVYMISEKAADILSEDHEDLICDALAAGNDDVLKYLQADPVFRTNRETHERSDYPPEVEAREAELIYQRREAANRG